ncbi:TonB C-terminal domain-containing protein [Massilia soli]|uniref:TonB C-terminal domain-containing protein n=1 Tax=Massilia soli TaxID=2792854 RepID=A0ABS7SK19_9BURK|nr:TonB C-terminal domain-containing protein [Massilia soli]
MVTVGIRAGGSVEKVAFLSSSGVPAIDHAIRKVIASQAPYGAFPPGLAREYDVIEFEVPGSLTLRFGFNNCRPYLSGPAVLPAVFVATTSTLTNGKTGSAYRN